MSFMELVDIVMVENIKDLDLLEVIQVSKGTEPITKHVECG